MNFLQAPIQAMKRSARVLARRDVYIPKQLDCGVVYLGKAGTSWPVCPDALVDQPFVYSFGVGEDVSFDLELIRRFHATIHAFDPTPRSVAWIAGQQLPANFNFHPYGVADHDGVCSFLPPENSAFVSHTMLNRQSQRPRIELPVYRLPTIMKMLGHTRVHILKMDIEGAEYVVLNDILSCGIKVDQLLVEFHHRWPEVGIEKTKRVIQQLNSVGYKIFEVSPAGEEYGFMYCDP